MVMLILFLGFCALSAQAATYEGAKLYRLVRSPYYGAHFHYDHPPFGPPPLFPAPPPIIYRTHNWSGVGRGIDGAVKGVFSGAAAAAGSAVPTLNSAFSIAEAGSTNGGLGVDSAKCDDNSHSSDSKITGQYNSKSSQYGSHQFGSGSTSHVGQVDNNSEGGFGGSSGYNSHSSFKESSSSFSQSGQNGASNGYGQESDSGFGGQTSNVNSGYDKNPRGYGGHGQSFKESYYSVQNGRGSEFGSQGSNNGKGYENFSGSGKSNEGGSNRPQAQGSSSNYGHFGASSHGSAQSGSSAFGSASNNYNSGAHGYDSAKVQAGGSANIESQQFKSTEGTEQSFGHGAGLASGQTGNNAAQFGPSSGFGSGVSNYNSGAHGYGSANLQAGESAKFESQAGAGVGHSFEHGIGLPSSQRGNNAAEFDQSSGSSDFGSGISNYNSGAHDYGSAKLQAGGSANFESQAGVGAEHSLEHGGGLTSGQTGNNAAEFGHSSGSSAFGSASSNYKSGAHGYGSAKLEAGGSANFESQQTGVGAEHSFEDGAGLASGQAGIDAVGQGQLGSTLHGALELASQGLQAADNAKCATCQKSSYALSNAKSHNGAAIALSIGG